jgi:hypothetical protein
MRRQDVAVLWYLRSIAINSLIPWTLRQAIDRGFQWYPIRVSNFGDVGALNVEPTNEIGVSKTLISEFPVVGIRIAASSRAARCRITYNPGQEIISTFSRPNPGPAAITLTHDAPWFGTLTAPLFVTAFGDQMYFDSYVKEDGVSTGLFGLAQAFVGNFTFPNLDLDLLLRGSGISAAKRKPLVNANFSTPLTGTPTEDTLSILPLDGRRRGRVTVSNPAGNPAAVSFRTTVIEMRSPSLPIFTVENTECELTAPVVVAVGATECVELPLPSGQYLMMKATSAGAAMTVNWSARLED